MDDRNGRNTHTGLVGNHNLYMDNDRRWLASYVPAVLQAFPFAIIPDKTGERLFCISSTHISTQSDERPFFDCEGNLAAETSKTLEHLKHCESNLSQTNAACEALSAANLLEPWNLKIGRGEGEQSLEINGLYKINEPALNSLGAQELADLRASGALTIAYAQLFSLYQLEQLSQRFDYLQGLDDKAVEDGLSSLIGDEEGALNFDFI